jgi:hypothetical protein
VRRCTGTSAVTSPLLPDGLHDPSCIARHRGETLPRHTLGKPNLGSIKTVNPVAVLSGCSVDSEADDDRLPVDAVNTVKIDFALEAKCYAETNSVGVREVSRFIRACDTATSASSSHLRISTRMYDEVRADAHPIALACGRDVVDTLRGNGY